ncbi:retron Ec67 family RNA-directed DNA polymerase/endonuclease [Sphingomonas sp. Y38-1Y]|uniref:retron Ec67 family RNA-directed DNA polymerase/endonuclease n=1 Tax=Sphingomonas sp. Y38-1Y TaxID=3078265 RepID=UPI0028E3D011|nr:retron Ec67 family RNA-directed DNA polymerase/endonuclease [Sphingomonas sp. Y38-1Y]
MGVEAKELSFVLYKMNEKLKYDQFCMSKKSGGTRLILKPHPRLKWIQRRLLDVLYECENDVVAASKKNSNLDFGFKRGVNIYDNAEIHRKKRYVLNMDIEDFFGQFNFGRVRGFFLKNHEFALHKDVATAIAQIACFEDTLPQGAPTSPHIANLIAQFFDRRMCRFLQSRRCHYSRYADDITISTNLREFPSDVAAPDSSTPQGWALSPQIIDIFARADFPIKASKTRMSLASNRQMVTGLVVNSHPNVSREYYLATRSMCHALFKTGKCTIPDFTPSFADNCPPEKEGDEKPSKSNMKILEGRLSHIHHIRSKSDTRTIQDKQDNPTQFWRTLQLFYIYKYFFGNDKPTILTEGPSDIFYIRAALLNSKSTNLKSLRDDKQSPYKIIPSFFNFDTNAAHVLGLTGGAGNIKRFLYLFNKNKDCFNHTLRKNPVVILIDNDSGGKDVLSQVNGIYKTGVSTDDTSIVHQITSGLILVKTPHVGTQKLTSIEDLLPANVKNVKLNGKTFSTAKKLDTSKHFGKVALSHYVRDNAAGINFDGLDPLLEGLNEAIKNCKI